MSDDYETHWQNMHRAARAIADRTLRNGEIDGCPVQGYLVARNGGCVRVHGDVSRLSRDGARQLAARLLLAAEAE